jgi:hypothetical protein
MRARKVIPLATAVAALGAVGVASAATGSYTTRDGALTATFSASTTHPNCKQLWPVTITAKLHGRKAHATAFYQFLFNGTVVATYYPFSDTKYNRHNHKWRFYGSFTDNTFGPFGALAVGHRLDVRAVVSVGSHTAWPGLNVTVRPARGCKARNH